MRGKQFITDLIGHIQHEEDEIEPREQTGREVDILNNRFFRIVLRVYRVGSCEYGSAGVELTDDACLGDGDGLLLHRLEQYRATILIHLVKFIDAAYALIGQDQCS
jgi:hypothetical protein